MTALGVLCCFALFVCLTLLASFFLPSHLSFKNVYMCFHFVAINDEKVGEQKADFMATFYDVGGILGE